MARGSRIAASGFGQFMATTAGRAVRVVGGVGLIAWGLAEADTRGYVLAAVGVVPLAAGALDRCVITGLVEGRWTGDSVRACAPGRADEGLRDEMDSPVGVDHV